MGARATLFEKLADDVARHIRAGTYRPGDRIPSVREIRRTAGVSMTTALEAYRLLEDRGIVEARQRSGYYVAAEPGAGCGELSVSNPTSGPAQVTVAELFVSLLKDTLDAGLVQFGAALPDPELLPTSRLNRILADVALHGDPRQTVEVAPAGCEALRVQVARRAFLSGCDLAPGDVLVTAGCMEALALCLGAVCRPGDLVAIESPSYAIQALEANRLRAVEIPTHPRDGLSLGALQAAVARYPIRACLVISNFNNPLGSCMPDDAKRDLVALLGRHEIPLIEDDIHGELYFSGSRPRTAKTFDRAGLVMLCSSFSKDISPGYRVGWVAPGRFGAALERLKVVTNLHTATLPQMVIARFLAQGGYDRHLRTIRRAYAQRTKGMAEAIERCFPAGTRVTAPAGGFVLWLELPPEVDSLALYRAAVRAGITLAPGYLFSAAPHYRNFIRLNAAYWSERTAPALHRLAELVQQAPRVLVR